MKDFYPLFKFYLVKQNEIIEITDGLRIVKDKIQNDDLSSFNSSKAYKINNTEDTKYCLEIDENFYDPKEASLGLIISGR